MNIMNCEKPYPELLHKPGVLDVHPNPAVLGDDDAEALVVPSVVALSVQQHLEDKKSK